MMDEVKPMSDDDNIGADWSDLKTRDNVDYLVALSPYVRDVNVNVTPPSDNLTLSHQLLTQHRNCPEIRKFVMFCIIFLPLMTKAWVLTSCPVAGCLSGYREQIRWRMRRYWRR
jgi:hypothetical protein